VDEDVEELLRFAKAIGAPRLGAVERGSEFGRRSALSARWDRQATS
jgi:hypothetical protein